MTTTIKRLAIALTSATAIVAAFSLAATPPSAEPAAAGTTPGTTVVIDLTDQHTVEGSTTEAAASTAATIECWA